MNYFPIINNGKIIHVSKFLKTLKFKAIEKLFNKVYQLKFN